MIIKNLDRIILDKMYNNKIQDFANEVRSFSNDKMEQCRYIYNWFCSNVNYDKEILKNGVNSDGLYTNIEHKYNGVTIWDSEKYCPMFLGIGVCKATSEMFKDICDVIGIECYIVSGMKDRVSSFKNKPHCWNEVQINGERFTIDLTFNNFLTPRRSIPEFTIKK